MLLPTLPKSGAIQDGPNGPILNVAQLEEAANDRASDLAARGLTAGQRLAVVPDRPVPLLIDMFAAWQCGALAVLLSPSLPALEIAAIEQSVRPDLWSLPDPAAAPPGSAALPSPDATRRGRRMAVRHDAALDDPALVLMTSGTTSTPKGVTLSHRALLARLALNVAHIGPEPLATSLCPLPLHFGHGLIGNALTPLFAGGQVILWPDAGIAGLSRLGEVIDDAEVRFMSSVPAIWQIALRGAQPPRRQSLQRVHVGSAPLSRDQWQAIAAWAGTQHIVNMYGMTEAANWIGGHDLADGAPADGLVGRPWGGALAVRSPDGSIAPLGRGEVLVASPSLMLGYLDQPEMTARSLPGGWLDTGDVGEIDGAGRLRLIGRTKFEINRAGIKIPAEEIDLLLQGHPEIAEACGFAMPDAVSGEAVAAAVVTEEGATIETDRLREWCRGRIRPQAMPSRLFVVDRLPRSDRGKVQRDQVAAICLGDQPPGAAP